MEKAYDRLNWEFLDYMLQRMGFGIHWRKWMSKCYGLASYLVLLNGSPAEYFHDSCGLWQGDPLSPFLFLVVADAFGVMLSKSFQGGMHQGFEVTPNRMAATNLQFVDDTIVMCKNSVRQLKLLRYVIRCFEAVSGLKINNEDNIMRLMYVPQHKRARFKFQCCVGLIQIL